MASFFFRLQPLICRSRARASSRVGNSSENTNVTGSLAEVITFYLTRLMLYDPFLKIIRVSCIVGLVGTTQDVNPKAHFLATICFCPSTSLGLPRAPFVPSRASGRTVSKGPAEDHGEPVKPQTEHEGSQRAQGECPSASPYTLMQAT